MQGPKSTVLTLMLHVLQLAVQLSHRPSLIQDLIAHCNHRATGFRDRNVKTFSKMIPIHRTPKAEHSGTTARLTVKETFQYALDCSASIQSAPSRGNSETQPSPPCLSPSMRCSEQFHRIGACGNHRAVVADGEFSCGVMECKG